MGALARCELLVKGSDKCGTGIPQELQPKPYWHSLFQALKMALVFSPAVICQRQSGHTRQSPGG